MEFNSKTSTHKLATKKDAKKVQKTAIHKKMNEIIGFQEFLDIEEKGRKVTAVLKCTSGYSMIIRVSSSDPHLLSEDDLFAFETTALSFTYALDFPLKYKRSSRKQNFKRYIEFINTISKNVKCSEYVEEYKNYLIDELKMMEKQTGSNIKLNYIVVFSNDPNEAVAKKELLDRANYIMRNLQDANFRTSVVANFDLLEYLYRTFHKELDIDLEKFIEQDAFSVVTKKIDEFGKPFKVTDEFLRNAMLAIEGEAKAELQKREQLKEKSPKEYKKYMAKQRKLKEIEEKKHKKSVEEYNLTQTGFIEILKPDIFVEEADYIRLGSNSYLRCLVVNTLPSSLNITTLNNLNTLENMELHVDLIKLNDARMSKTLRAESNKVISNIYLKEKETGTREHAQRKLVSNMEAIIESIETNADKLFSCQVLVVLYSDDLADLEDKTKTIKENFANLGMDLRVMFYDQKIGFMNTLPTPFMKYKNNMKNITAGGASCLLPSGCTHLRHPEGRFIGRSLLTNYPVILDPFICQKPHLPESEMYSNPNVYVCGKPGSGKSSFLKTQISRSSFLGDLFVVLDPHNEYREEAKILGGKYIYLKNGIKTGINPLEIKSIIDDETGEEIVPINEKVATITAMINNFIATYRAGNGLKGIEISTVSEAIKSIYEKKGITTNPESLFTIKDGIKIDRPRPILNDLRIELELRGKEVSEIIEIADMLKLITGDGMMNLFDCETDEAIAKLLSTRFVVFSLRDLDDLTKTYAMTTILNWLWAMFSAKEMKNIQKNIGVDEGYRFAKHKQSLELLEEFARSCRKFLISLVISSQSIQEFSSTIEGRAILDFCSFKYIFRQDARLSNEIAEYFGLSDSAKKSLPNFQKGQCIISTELGNIMVQVDLFEKEKEFATTSGNTLAESTGGRSI